MPDIHLHRHVAQDGNARFDGERIGCLVGPADDFEFAVKGGTRIKVESFDLAGERAQISVVQQAGVSASGPGVLFGGVTSGGDRWMVLPSGHVVRIPPRSPFVAVMNQIAAITEAEQRLSDAAGMIAVHALYTGLVGMVESAAKARIAQAPSLKLRE